MKLNEHIVLMKQGDFSQYQEFNDMTKDYIYNIVYMVTGEADTANTAFATVYNDIFKTINQLTDENDFLRWAGIKASIAAFSVMMEKYPGMLGGVMETLGQIGFDHVSMDDERFIPDKALNDMKFARQMITDMATVSVVHRTAMQLFYYFGMDVAGIVAAIGVEEGKVRTAIADLRNLAKNEIYKFYGEGSGKLTSLAETPLFWIVFTNAYSDRLSSLPDQMIKTVAACGAAGVVAGGVIAGAVATSTGKSAAGSSVAAAGTKAVKGASKVAAGAKMAAGASSTATAMAGATGSAVTGAVGSAVAGAVGSAGAAAGAAGSAAATGFFATVAGKITIGIAALAVAGSVGGAAVYNHMKNKDNKGNTDKVQVEASTAVGNDDQAGDTADSGDDNTEAATEAVDNREMYNIRQMQFTEECGDLDYIYIDGDGYDELKNSVESDNARLRDEVAEVYDGYGVDYTTGDREDRIWYQMDLLADITRCDSRVLSIDYEKSEFEGGEKCSENYDVLTGKKLTIQDLGITDDEFRSLVKAKLTEDYRTGIMKDSTYGADDKDDIINATVEARASKACEIILNDQPADYVSYEADYMQGDYPLGFNDNIDWKMNHEGIVVYWHNYRQDYYVYSRTEIVIPYGEFSNFNKDYLPDEENFSGVLGLHDTVSVDVNSDGYVDTLSFNREDGEHDSYGMDWGIFVNWDGVVLDDDADYRPANRIFAETSDGKYYMINSYFQSTYDDVYTNDMPYSESATTYVYDVSTGTPVRVDDGCDELYVCNMSGDYAFCKNVLTGEYGYYALTDTGLEYQPDMYQDDTELKRAYGAYIEIVQYMEGDPQHSTYGLVYVDDDDIPELVAVNTMAGAYICTYGKGHVSKYSTGLSYDVFSYIERSGLFALDSGRQGIFYDFIERVEDGEITEEAVGRWELTPDSCTYTWDDEEISQSEYEEKLGEVYSGDKISLNSVCTFDANQILEQLK